MPSGVRERIVGGLETGDFREKAAKRIVKHLKGFPLVFSVVISQLTIKIVEDLKVQTRTKQEV